jgi:hypothetical protein
VTDSERNMSPDTIYAYVDGSDLHGVAREIETAILDFVRSHSWRFAPPEVVNHQHPADPKMQPGDLPDWDLGVNLRLPAKPIVEAGVLDDLVALTKFLHTLHRETNREFVLGLADSKTGTAEDCLFVGKTCPTAAELRRLL